MFNRLESGGLVHGAWVVDCDCSPRACGETGREKVPDRTPVRLECQPTGTRQIFCISAAKSATSLDDLVKMGTQPFLQNDHDPPRLANSTHSPGDRALSEDHRHRAGGHPHALRPGCLHCPVQGALLGRLPGNPVPALAHRPRIRAVPPGGVAWQVLGGPPSPRRCCRGDGALSINVIEITGRGAARWSRRA